MSADCIAIVGLQWGDEGKGKIVDWLSGQAKHVARFQGGNNAGHTIVIDGHRIVLHLVPSGILHPQTQCYIGPGVVLDCSALASEVTALNSLDIEFDDRLIASSGCAMILRHHRELDRARESGENKIGTTLRGIGPAHEDRSARRAVRVRDVLAGLHADRVRTSVEHANREIVARGGTRIEPDEVADEAAEQVRAIGPFIGRVTGKLIDARTRGERILLEGSQGALLDIDQGTYPHVTSSSCLASAATAGLGVDLQPLVIGVAKAYATRVGNGVFPTELSGDQAHLLQEEGMEFGATTHRLRRVGWLDMPALRHSLALNACSRIVLTKMDVLSSWPKIRICTSYRHGNEKFDRMIPDSNWLEQCEKQYEDLEGWEEFEPDGDLPSQAQAYVSRIENLADVNIDVISVGADRNENIVRRYPWD